MAGGLCKDGPLRIASNICPGAGDKEFKEALERQGLNNVCCTVLRDRGHDNRIVGALQV